MAFILLNAIQKCNYPARPGRQKRSLQENPCVSKQPHIPTLRLTGRAAPSPAHVPADRVFDFDIYNPPGAVAGFPPCPEAAAR